MDIRRYLPTDRDACGSIVGEGWTDPPESYFVAEHDGRVIGCGGYGVDASGGSAWLFGLAVDPAFRRMGVGRFLAMYSLRELSKRHGVRMVSAQSPETARGFLEALGFRSASAGDGTVEMVKKLEVCA